MLYIFSAAWMQALKMSFIVDFATCFKKYMTSTQKEFLHGGL